MHRSLWLCCINNDMEMYRLSMSWCDVLLLAWFHLHPLTVAIEHPLFSLLIKIGYGDTNLATFGRNYLHCVGCNELYPA